MEGMWASLKGELPAVLSVAGILAAFAAIGFYRSAGEATSEVGRVVRFGSYSNELGNQPTVIVQTTDGRQAELFGSAGVLRQCRAGMNIALIRKTNSLRVDPRGCR